VRVRRKFIVFLCVLATGLSGCGKGDPDKASPEQPSPMKKTPAPTAEKTPPTPSAPEQATGYVRVVDRAGNPLPNMTPIVTTQPNAFDKPVAMGAPTDGDGKGQVRFVSDQLLFLRAWDPLQRWYPNNFYEFMPGGNVADNLEIVMVRAAALEVHLVHADGGPIADEEVGMIMLHPTRGPWWPAQGQSDASGRVFFKSVPPGQFVFRFKVESSGTGEVPETPLPPGETAVLGVVTLE
jgi:hypothetical protein